MAQEFKEAEPRLGLFWGIPTSAGRMRLLGSSKPVSMVAEIGGFKTVDAGHIDVWPNLSQQFTDIKGYEYEHFPRGRVNWRKEDDRFLLLLDRKLMTETFIALVVSRWHLPKSNLIIGGDPHYKSA